MLTAIDLLSSTSADPYEEREGLSTLHAASVKNCVKTSITLDVKPSTVYCTFDFRTVFQFLMGDLEVCETNTAMYSLSVSFRGLPHGE